MISSPFSRGARPTGSTARSGSCKALRTDCLRSDTLVESQRNSRGAYRRLGAGAPELKSQASG